MKNKVVVPTFYLHVDNQTAGHDFSRQQLRAWMGKMWQLIAQRLELNCQEIAVGLRLVNEKESQTLNAQYRQKDYPTNILTFEYGVDASGTLSSDMIVCMPVLKKEAKAQSKTLNQHMVHLLLHGLLHALGFDHLTDEEADEMESLEIEILQEMGYPNPYL